MESWIEAARAAWRWRGQERPEFAVEPGPGQESVWDYPRPPAVEPVSELVRVAAAGERLAESRRALRVLETASAPTVYLPPEDVRMELLRQEGGSGVCEWKGPWVYWTVLANGVQIPRAAWSYTEPFAGYQALRGHLAFYPARVECRLGDERVRPQPGGFYGGWVTSAIVGPIKGEPGSGGW